MKKSIVPISVEKPGVVRHVSCDGASPQVLVSYVQPGYKVTQMPVVYHGSSTKVTSLAGKSLKTAFQPSSVTAEKVFHFLIMSFFFTNTNLPYTRNIDN